MTSKAAYAFWLDGGYDFDSVEACQYHPRHNWVTLRMGDVLQHPSNPAELLTICSGCYVPRCGTTGDLDRCIYWRHHNCDHMTETRLIVKLGGSLV